MAGRPAYADLECADVRLKPDPEEADRLIEKWSAQRVLHLEVGMLVLPAAIGLFLLVEGISEGQYMVAGIGLVLLAVAPFLARRLIRKSEFGHHDD